MYKINYLNNLSLKGKKNISEYLSKYNYAESYFYVADNFWEK